MATQANAQGTPSTAQIPTMRNSATFPSDPKLSLSGNRSPARRTISNTSLVSASSHPLGPSPASPTLLADPTPTTTAPTTPPPPPLPERSPHTLGWSFHFPELQTLFCQSVATHPILQEHTRTWGPILKDVDNFMVGFLRWAATSLNNSPRSSSESRGSTTPRSSMELDPNIVADHYQQFIEDIHASLNDKFAPIFAAARTQGRGEELDGEALAMSWLSDIEDVCTTLIYPHTFCPQFPGQHHNDHWQDEATASRIAALNMADIQLSHLGLDLDQSPFTQPPFRFDPADLNIGKEHLWPTAALPTLPTQPLGFHAFIDEALRQTYLYLQAMDRQKSVMLKMECIVGAHQVLTKAAQTRPLPIASANDSPAGVAAEEKEGGLSKAPPQSATLTADDLLPLMIYTVIHYNPPRLVSNLHYIQHYLYQPRQTSGIPAYCLTTLSAAISFLDTVDMQALGLATHQFDDVAAPDTTISPTGRSSAVHGGPSAVHEGSAPSTAGNTRLGNVIGNAIYAVQHSLPSAWSTAVAAVSTSPPGGETTHSTSTATASTLGSNLPQTDILNFSFSPNISRQNTNTDTPAVAATATAAAPHASDLMGGKELVALDNALLALPASPSPNFPMDPFGEPTPRDSVDVPGTSPGASWLPTSLKPTTLISTPSLMNPINSPTLTSTADSPPLSAGSGYLSNPLTNRVGKEIRDVTDGGMKVISGVYGMVFSRFKGPGPVDSNGNDMGTTTGLDRPLVDTSRSSNELSHNHHHNNNNHNHPLASSPATPTNARFKGSDTPSPKLAYSTAMASAHPLHPAPIAIPTDIPISTSSATSSSSSSSRMNAPQPFPQARLVRRQTEPASSRMGLSRKSSPRSKSPHTPPLVATQKSRSPALSRVSPTGTDQHPHSHPLTLPTPDPFFANCQLQDMTVPQIEQLLREYQKLAAAINQLKKAT
ncbi:hypothetical protein H4R33_005981 [Dimargaris cristalligena]|nr:hypothetical protein H4R33_005981 [Dimargaris cristalligena]